MRNSSLAAACAAGILAGACSSAALAEAALGVSDPESYLMTEAEEIALSRSAAPEAVSADASILVLKADGTYATAIEGTNGWTCFTGRSWTGPARFTDGKRVWSESNFDPNIKAPQCFNAAAAQSLLEIHRIATRHFMQGASVTEVDLAIGESLTTGAVAMPGEGAMSYMFSPHQVLTPDGGRFHPHVMLYMPYVTQESYGRGSPMQGVPMVTEGGSIFATVVILSPKWSDGTPAG